MVHAARMFFKALCLCILALRVRATNETINLEVISQCNLSEDVRAEINVYKKFVHDIYEYVVNGTDTGRTYQIAAELADDFGPRFTGSKSLEDAIDFAVHRLLKTPVDRVWTEQVKVPFWVRGQEFVYMLHPRKQKIAMLGLGGSVGTPVGGIAAEAVVVKSFGELRRNADIAKGRIVVFDQEYTNYETSALYRIYGARAVAKVGGVAALVRSPTPFSLYTVHGGLLHYDPDIPQIPSASITVEDAEMLRRLFDRGHVITLQLYMEARNYPYAISRNIFAEIKGREKPHEMVVVSGHIDSWDFGQGALDDAGGAVLAMRVFEVLRHLNFRPRRTLRLVLWTGEEVGRFGRHDYIRKHRNEAAVTKLLLNTEMGNTPPRGLTINSANQEIRCVLREIVSLFGFMGANHLRERHGKAVYETRDFFEEGIPVAAMENKNDVYFLYHHSPGDTVTVLNPHFLDLNTAFWTCVSFITSNLVTLF